MLTNGSRASRKATMGTAPASGIEADDVYGHAPCTRCKGDGLGGGYSTATCSKCGQSAMSRSMWEGP